jgi:hypothetical protein
VGQDAGQGSFYRSQHELIGVVRVGDAPHLNNVKLGRHGRSRSNVWRYPGVNSFAIRKISISHAWTAGKEQIKGEKKGGFPAVVFAY